VLFLSFLNMYIIAQPLLLWNLVVQVVKKNPSRLDPRRVLRYCCLCGNQSNGIVYLYSIPRQTKGTQGPSPSLHCQVPAAALYSTSVRTFRCYCATYFPYILNFPKPQTGSIVGEACRRHRLSAWTPSYGERERERCCPEKINAKK
jgi:hypothetical protein